MADRSSTVWLDSARIISMFAVVLIHICAFAINGSAIGSERWWIANVYDSMVRWAVPVFVMISGALLLEPGKSETVSLFYKKRFSKILLPLLFWTAFYLIWGSQNQTISGDLFKNTIHGKPYYHLWFLFMIGMLYLITPFVRKIVNNCSSKEITVFVSISLVAAGANAIYSAVYGIETRLFAVTFLNYLGYFVLGRVIRFDNTAVKQHSWALVFVVAVIATICGCYFWSDYKNRAAGSYFYNYLSITVIPMSISVMYLFKGMNKPVLPASVQQFLAPLSMGIYLIHPMYIVMLDNHGLNFKTGNALVSIPLVAILVTLVSLVFSWLISQSKLFRRII